MPFGRRENGTGRVEVFLTKPVGELTWEALVHPGRKMCTGERIIFVSSLGSTETAPLALACFLRQTWKEKELIVLDWGAKPVSALFAEIPGVHYLRLSRQATLGECRNLAVHARQFAIFRIRRLGRQC